MAMNQFGIDCVYKYNSYLMRIINNSHLSSASSSFFLYIIRLFVICIIIILLLLLHHKKKSPSNNKQRHTNKKTITHTDDYLRGMVVGLLTEQIGPTRSFDLNCWASLEAEENIVLRQKALHRAFLTHRRSNTAPKS